MKYSPPQPSHPRSNWVKTLNHLTLSQKKNQSSQVKTKLRRFLLLTVEYLSEDTNLCKREVHSAFGILVGGIFKTQFNIYDGDFPENS